jgi:hypothetical protein
MDGFDDTVCPGAIGHIPWPIMALMLPAFVILFPFFYAAALVPEGKRLWDKVTGNHEFVRFEPWWWDLDDALGVPFKPARAVCSCGWRSPVIDDDHDALTVLFEEHAR